MEKNCVLFCNKSLFRNVWHRLLTSSQVWWLSSPGDCTCLFSCWSIVKRYVTCCAPAGLWYAYMWYLPGIFRELPEMSRKISSEIYHFLPKFWNRPHLNEEFSYIFYTFFHKPPWAERKISLMPLWNLALYGYDVLNNWPPNCDNDSSVQLTHITYKFTGMHKIIARCTCADTCKQGRSVWMYTL